MNNHKVSHERRSELDSLLAWHCLSSVFCYANILSELADHQKGEALTVLAHDAERRIAQVFAQINAQHPGIKVVSPDCGQETAYLFLK